MQLFKNAEEQDDYEDVSYDVMSLFTATPVKEIIAYIIQKKIVLFYKKSIFKKLVRKLTQECVFSINNRPFKQVDDCPMGRLMSAVFSDI